MTAWKSIRVAIAQPYTKLGDVQGNLAQVLDLASEAAASRCDIVLYPEVALHGYSIPPHVLAAAITDDGPEVAALLEHADTLNIHLAVGAYEKDRESGDIYISQFIARPGGELIVQRKFGGHEKPGIARAPFGPIIFEIKGVRCAVVICIDSKHPDLREFLVKNGCHVELVPVAGGGAYGRFQYKDMDDPERNKAYEEAMAASCFPRDGALRGRYQMRMALACCNLATGDDGHDYFQQGHSMLIDSDGSLLVIIPGAHIQEQFRPKIAWADLHARTPRMPPPETQWQQAVCGVIREGTVRGEE